MLAILGPGVVVRTGIGLGVEVVVLQVAVIVGKVEAVALPVVLAGVHAGILADGAKAAEGGPTCVVSGDDAGVGAGSGC